MSVRTCVTLFGDWPESLHVFCRHPDTDWEELMRIPEGQAYELPFGAEIRTHWIHRERVWEGAFHSQPEASEWDAMLQELRDAAARYSIPLKEAEHMVPYGIRDES